MQSLIQGKRTIGEIGDDGSVYAGVGRNRQQVGAVAADGTVLLGGQAVGRVDAAGNIFNAAGAAVGTVNKGGKVFHDGKSVGYVPGDDPRYAGAALLLLFDEPVRYQGHQPEQHSGSPNWIVLAIGAGLALLVVTVAIAFVVATAVVWAVMLLLASLSALWLASEVSRTLPQDQLTALQTVTWTTKRGEVTQISPSSLSPLLGLLPLLFLALTPALAYGFVIGFVSLGASSPDNVTGNLVLFLLAIAAGTTVSYLAARKILRTRLNTLLLTRRSAFAATPVGITRDWNRFAGYAGLGLAALFILGGGGAAWQASRNAPLHTATVTASTPDVTGASSPIIATPSVAADAATASSGVGATVASMPGERFPQTRTGFLHDSDINGWSYSGVRYALNEIYARHGYSFKAAPILHQFQKFSWYQPVAGRSQPQIEAQFTPTERANQLLLAHRRDALQRAGQAIK